MPKFHGLTEYAAAIAPVINAAHINVHAAAHQAVTELADAAGLTPGYLSDLRFSLPLRPVTRAQLGTIYRYRDTAERESGIQEHLREGTLTDDGALRLTGEGLAFIHRLYAAHAAAADRVWAGTGLPRLAELADRVLAEAERVPGGALELVAPPYEPEWAAPGLLLFNRLAVLRYHRADAHAAAWQAAGLSAAEIAGLEDGPVRAGIEADTNLRAGAAYAQLSAAEREIFHEGLLKLI
ncbi:hypothetical protein [Nonomuraea sp. NPDC049480]|uniref:hypothetical protein n=1 Tax=Nonomuraea sp. NPDC049480 TaxID=3364353 RepID=UPI003794E3AB